MASPRFPTVRGHLRLFGAVGLALCLAACARNAPPVVALTAAPATSGTVRLEASAADDFGVTKVEFYRDGAPFASDAAAPYGATDNFAAHADQGSVAYTARAFDAAGNVSTSAPAEVAQVERLRGTWGFRYRLPYGSTFFQPYVLSVITRAASAPGGYTLAGRNTDEDAEGGAPVVGFYDPQAREFQLLDPADGFDRLYIFTFAQDDPDVVDGSYYPVSSNRRGEAAPFEGVRDASAGAALGSQSLQEERPTLRSVSPDDPVLRRYARLKQLQREEQRGQR